MRLPVIQGVIDRRILVNYRADPAVVQGLLPEMFRPKLVDGFAIAGICLIRLKHLRPKFLPRGWGIGSENAAHRIAVEWDELGSRREGVYIPRRDTNSQFNALAGGRLFPGEHHHACFHVEESAVRLAISLDSDDGKVQLAVTGRVSDRLPEASVFSSLNDASAFFESGSLGYSVTSEPGRYDGLELRCKTWQVTPLDIDRVESSYFDDRAIFPQDRSTSTARFSCATLNTSGMAGRTYAASGWAAYVPRTKLGRGKDCCVAFTGHCPQTTDHC